jgi:hypothetical protein
MMGPPRRLVLETSGVARRLVWDPRFLKTDRQLLYGIEQYLVGDLKIKQNGRGSLGLADSRDRPNESAKHPGIDASGNSRPAPARHGRPE